MTWPMRGRSATRTVLVAVGSGTPAARDRAVAGQSATRNCGPIWGSRGFIRGFAPLVPAGPFTPQDIFARMKRGRSGRVSGAENGRADDAHGWHHGRLRFRKSSDMPMDRPVRPLRVAISASIWKCADASSSTGGMHIRPSKGQVKGAAFGDHGIGIGWQECRPFAALRRC